MYTDVTIERQRPGNRRRVTVETVERSCFGNQPNISNVIIHRYTRHKNMFFMSLVHVYLKMRSPN